MIPHLAAPLAMTPQYWRVIAERNGTLNRYLVYESSTEEEAEQRAAHLRLQGYDVDVSHDADN